MIPIVAAIPVVVVAVIFVGRPLAVGVSRRVELDVVASIIERVRGVDIDISVRTVAIIEVDVMIELPVNLAGALQWAMAAVAVLDIAIMAVRIELDLVVRAFRSFCLGEHLRSALTHIQ